MGRGAGSGCGVGVGASLAPEQAHRACAGSQPRLLHALVLGLALGLALAAPLARAEAQDLDPRWRDAFARGLEQLREGRYEQSIATFERLSRERPDQPETYYNAACAYALLGEREQALAWLERSIERGFRDLEHIEGDADLDALRLDPAFDALLERRLGRPKPGPWLATLDGAPVDLGRLRGQVVVLVSWSAASDPSRATLRAVAALDEGHREAGVVGLGMAPEGRDEQERFADEHKLALGLLRRTGPGPRPFAEAQALPTTFIFDRKGRLRHRLVGAHDQAEIEALLAPLVAEGQAAPPRLPEPAPPPPSPPSPPSPRRTF